MLLILVVTCYNSAFSCQAIKEYNCNHGKRNQILIVKTKLETITSLFIGIVLISKLQGWNDNYVQVNGRAILLCRNRNLQYTLICMFSFAKGDLHCYSLTPHLLPLPCLMFKLLPQLCCTFYTTWFAPNFEHAWDWNRIFGYAWTRGI